MHADQFSTMLEDQQAKNQTESAPRQKMSRVKMTRLR